MLHAVPALLLWNPPKPPYLTQVFAKRPNSEPFLAPRVLCGLLGSSGSGCLLVLWQPCGFARCCLTLSVPTGYLALLPLSPFLGVCHPPASAHPHPRRHSVLITPLPLRFPPGHPQFEQYSTLGIYIPGCFMVLLMQTLSTFF